MTVRAKWTYLLLNELKQFKHSSSTKNAAANKVRSKHKKQCQMFQSLRKQKIVFPLFEFFVVKLKQLFPSLGDSIIYRVII